MQNDTRMTQIMPKSKPDIELKYGGRPFSETGSSFISAVDWDIFIEIWYKSRVQLLKQNPEVDFRLYGRHLGKSIWRHNSAGDHPIITKFGRRM